MSKSKPKKNPLGPLKQISPGTFSVYPRSYKRVARLMALYGEFSFRARRGGYSFVIASLDGRLEYVYPAKGRNSATVTGFRLLRYLIHRLDLPQPEPWEGEGEPPTVEALVEEAEALRLVLLEKMRLEIEEEKRRWTSVFTRSKSHEGQWFVRKEYQSGVAGRVKEIATGDSWNYRGNMVAYLGETFVWPALDGCLVYTRGVPPQSGGPANGMWISGFRLLRYLLYEMDKTQPRKLKGEERIPCRAELCQEVADRERQARLKKQLSAAIAEGNAEGVGEVLSRGACQSPAGLLDVAGDAIRAGSPEVLEVVIEHGMTVWSDLVSSCPEHLVSRVLIEAVRGRSVGSLEVLLRAGMSPNVASEEGETPLIAAARYKQTAMVETLARAGADPHFRDQLAEARLFAKAPGRPIPGLPGLGFLAAKHAPAGSKAISVAFSEELEKWFGKELVN